MIKAFRKVYPVYVLIDLILISLIFYIHYFFTYNNLRDGLSNRNLPFLKEYNFIFVLWAIFILRSFWRINLYTTDRALSIPREIFRVIISIFYATILIGSIIYFAKFDFFSRKIFLASFILLCLILSLWRVIKRLILRKLILDGFHNINVLIIGIDRIAKIVAEEIIKNSLWGFKVVGFLDYKVDRELKAEENDIEILGGRKDFDKVVKKYFVDEVIIASVTDKKLIPELVQQAKNLYVGIRMVPEDFDESVPILSVTHLGFVPMLTYGEKRHHLTEFALKRIFDFLVSLILLILLSPMFLIIAILIKLDSDGPVFYVQKRVGFKGRFFNFYKFRSMVKDADSLKPALLEKNEIKDGIIFKIKKDPRITVVGKVLRKHSLDELPQLFNVLKGDMSLVGPRPPVPGEVEKYNHFHMQRLSVRPGITGLSQIRGRSDLSFHKWVKWDSWYINNWSFILDLKILLWTLPAVFCGKGAY